MRLAQTAILLVPVLAGCAATPKTEITIRDNRFSNYTVKKVGVIKFDAYPLKKAGAQPFGLIGALAQVTTESVKNSSDNSVDKEGIALHQKLSLVLKERFGATKLFQFKDGTSESEPDSVALSRQLRSAQFWGSNPPKDKEISDFAHKHELDYAVYGVAVYGKTESMVTDKRRLFMETKWLIYDAGGKEAVSVSTRSIDEKTAPNTLTATDTAIKFQELFGENVDRFFSALAGSSVKKDEGPMAAEPSSGTTQGQHNEDGSIGRQR